MPRARKQPQSDPDRLLPVVAAAFAELGYRRATTAQLARRCGVRENILYRVWPNKKAMFLESIEYVFDASMGVWERLLAESRGPEDAAQRVLEHEAAHHGEFGLYRIVFAGLSETDDPQIRSALRRMYERFGRFIASRISAARGKDGHALPADVAAWAMVGVGTVSNIARELGLLSADQRRRLFQQLGRLLLKGGGQ